MLRDFAVDHRALMPCALHPGWHNGVVDQDLATLGKSIDPIVLGERIRRARFAAGLTQAQLASGDASTAYVSRIEAGQRRPDLRLLQKIAPRLHVTVEELVTGVSRDRASELQLALDLAELALLSGDAENAARQAGEILAGTEGTGPTEFAAGARIVQALALEALGRVEEALDQLEALTASGVEAGRRWQLQIALCRCYRESGDLSAAIEVGEAALTELEVRGLSGADEAVQVTVTLASAYFERGDTSRAARLCRRAIDSAERLDSPAAIAAAYWNASVMESKEGDATAALAMAQRAILHLEASEPGRNLGRLRTQLGILQLRMDPPEATDATATLERAWRELDWSSASPADKADNQLAQARAAFLLDDLEMAVVHLDAACQGVADQMPFVAADARVLRGQISAKAGDAEAATQAYLDAVLILTGVGSDRRAAQLWFDLGELLDELGRRDEARDAYRRAAASTGLRQTRSRAPHR